jgi:hypothetical protein
VRVLEQLDSQFRHIVWGVSSALPMAALLRHTLHVYGGFSREDIRVSALVAAIAIALVIIFSQRFYRQ